VVEPVTLDECGQGVHILLGLAGKPTMKVVRRRHAGTAVADLVEQDVVAFAGPGLFIRFNTGSDACCSGRSMYLQTFSHSAIAASVASSIVVGYR
jgi:hypothetical protein